MLPETAMRWGYVVTTFKRPRIDESGSNLDQNLDHADPDPIQIDPDVGGDIPCRLLSTLRKNPLISRKLLADELNVSERKIRDSLKILRDSGVVVRQGPDHGGIWRISRIIVTDTTVKHGTNEVIKGGNKGGKSSHDPINGRGEAIIEVINEAIKTKPGINKPCLIKAVGKSRATVERAIAALVVAQKIEHRGSKKTGGYYAVE